MKESPPEVAASSATPRRSTGLVPVDLVGVGGFVLLAGLVLIVWNPPSPAARAAVGVPLVLFAPGYALVSALYPRSTAGAEADGVRGVSAGERAALSFGSSVALLPFFGLLIATVAAFTPAAVVVVLGGFALVVATFAAVRRLRVPPPERYRVDVAGRATAFGSWLYRPEAPLSTVVNVVLVASVVLALSTGGYALVAPQDGERYTSLQLLTEDDGEYVAAGYPDAIEPGEDVPLTVAVENREGEPKEYALVVQQQRLEDGEVVERESLERLEYSVDDGSWRYDDRTVTPTAEEGEIRLAFLLYEAGEVPETPTTENAYRYTHLWIDVESPEA